MPSKKKNKDNQNSGLQHENALEAVVVADSFDNEFLPVIVKQPKSLLPIANQPLLSYTLEFLASSEVKKIYVYSCHCGDQVKAFLQNSKWSNKSSPCTVIPVLSSDLSSVGDVLRDVDQKSLFESDFLFVPGDTVSNLQLKEALAEHKERREKDKNKPLMTLLLQNLSPNHHARSADNDILIASDKKSNRVLHYHQFSSHSKSIQIPLNVFHSQDSAVQVRYDLMDTGIWICSPQVPPLFSDNFDYQTQFDFIKGVLVNEEFLGNHIHMHVLKSQYCARVSNFYMYDIVSRDVISRWTYPLVPELIFDSAISRQFTEGSRYQLLRHNVYLAPSCVLGHNSAVTNNSVIGAHSTVGSNCRISDSVIGNGCKLEDDCVISGSYIWNNSTIMRGCKVVNSLICNDVTVHEGVTIESGCILCNRVAVGPDTTIPTETVLCLAEECGVDDDESSQRQHSPDAMGDGADQLGAKLRGVVWKKDVDSDSESGDELARRLWGLSLRERVRLAIDDDAATVSDATSGMSSANEIESDESDEELPIDDDLSNFQREVKESLLGGYSEKAQCDNLILEVNSSKYAYNVSMKDVVQTVTSSLFEMAGNDPDSSYFASLKKILEFFLPLLCNYNKTLSAQLDCLYAIEEHAAKHENVAACLMNVFMFLYENDVLSEQAILKWNGKSDVSYLAIFTPMEIRAKVVKFIQWLLEAEEEDSSD